MAQQVIKLKIANKDYSFNIEREKEELYRLGARDINAYIASSKKHNNFKDWADQDYLGVVALNLAIGNANMKQSREVGSADLISLKEMGDEIDTYLNKLTNETK